MTQNIDIMPTLLEFFKIHEKFPYPLHGKSLAPVLNGKLEQVRDGVIFGYFGKQTAYTDGTYVYMRAAEDESNRPLHLYTAVPSILRQYLGGGDGIAEKDYDKIEMGRFLPWTKYPVYKIPADIVVFKNPSQEFSRRSDYNKDTLLFYLTEDYEQERPVSDEKLEKIYIQKLRQCMLAHDALPEQLERLGI